MSFERIQFDTTKYVGAKSKCLSVANLREHLPGLELTPLREGLARTIGGSRNTRICSGESRARRGRVRKLVSRSR